MNPQEFHNYGAKKAFEIGYAFFRLAKYMQSTGYAESLERQALAILAAATEGAYVKLQNALVAGEYFLKLGEEVNLVARHHADMVTREIRQLHGEIEEFLIAQPAVSLEDVFSPKNDKKESGNKQSGNESGNPATPNVAGLTAKPDLERRERNIEMEVRQNLILSRIRQSGNSKDGCRFKDLQDVLPNTSERTIRYDLEDLIARGLIERSGGGGPATFYRTVSVQASALPIVREA